MPRIQSHHSAFNDRPFAGSGASLYATAGERVLYRALRVLPNGRRRARNRCGWIKGQGGRHDLAADSVLKTTRLASVAAPADSFDAVALPAAFADQTVVFDVRQFKDDVENTTDNFRTVTIDLDGDLENATGILGTAVLLDLQVRSGGVVRIRLNWLESLDGVQPTVFRAVRTAGPTSPVSATSSYTPGQRLVEIDTPALSDVAPYTYKIVAENTAGTVTSDVLTGISVQADATGPAAPISGSAEAR